MKSGNDERSREVRREDMRQLKEGIVANPAPMSHTDCCRSRPVGTNRRSVSRIPWNET